MLRLTDIVKRYTTGGATVEALRGVTILPVDIYESDHIVEHVREVAPYLESRLNELIDKYDFMIEHRGCGLMQGIKCNRPVGDIINRALENGLILINAGADIIRFVPPLIIEKEHIDKMIEILDRACEET